MILEAALCLALNVYHEARGEPIEGRIAVALATRNRVLEEGHGYCRVVFKHKQYSWTLDPKKLERLPRGPEWLESKRVAEYVLHGGTDFTKGATYFHATTVAPRWASALEMTGKWGNHIFYRARPVTGIMGHSLKANVQHLKAIVKPTTRRLP